MTRNGIDHWRVPIMSIVRAATEGKYLALNADCRARILDAAWAAISGAADIDALYRLVRTPDTAEDDIHNQMVVLALLTIHPREALTTRTPVQEVHRLIHGINEQATRRRSRTVEDFDAPLPTAPDELPQRMDEFERGVFAMAHAAPRGDADASWILAHVLSGIIRIHYFEDGNGRTARLICQHLLRCWGRPLLPIPKVRNDPSWKVSLSSAMDGDIAFLARDLEARIGGTS